MFINNPISLMKKMLLWILITQLSKMKWRRF